MSTATDDLVDDEGLWVIDVLERVHQRMLVARDQEGIRCLSRMSDDELIRLARTELTSGRSQ